MQNRALGLVIETHRVLDEMHALDPEFDVEIHRVHLVRAEQAVYGYEPVWKASMSASSNERPVLTDTSGLRTVASAIRLHRRGGGVGDIPDREALLAVLREALDEVGQATYLRPEVRAYVWSLIHRAMSLVEDSTSTAGQIRSAVFEASGALVSVEQTADIPADKKGRLRRVAETIAVGVLVDLAKDGVVRALGVGVSVAHQIIEATGN